MWLSKTDFVHCIIIKKGKIMGKMKELFIQQMNEQIVDMSDAEYQDWLHSQEITGIPNGDTMSDTDEDEPATQAEVESEHDVWWNSLTDKQKQQLYDGQEEVFRLSIEEMNTDFGFGI